MSGSALADVAGLGKMQIPQMVRAGYPYGFAAGLTASSSLISPVMPPSIPAVIYAATATVSTGALFAASVDPGAPHGARALHLHLHLDGAPPGPRPRCRSTAGGSCAGVDRRHRPAHHPGDPARRHPLGLLHADRGGRRSPCLYMLILGVIYRTASLRVLLQSLRETAVITGGITLILGAAALLGLILTRAHVSQRRRGVPDLACRTTRGSS